MTKDEKKKMFKTEVEPLVNKIKNICKEHDIPFLTTFIIHDDEIAIDQFQSFYLNKNATPELIASVILVDKSGTIPTEKATDLLRHGIASWSLQKMQSEIILNEADMDNPQ